MDPGEHRKYSFPPVADEKTEILILGTMPGETSFARQQYYAHPRNRFWPVMEYVTGSVFPVGYEDRLKTLLGHRIGLWNVLHSAQRSGSLDSSIRQAQPNSLPEFLLAHPAIKIIAFNGLQVESLFKKYFDHDASMRYLALPATSPANARIRLEELKSVWKTQLTF